MFPTKGRLKISLLVVGVLVVGFGMYAAFQSEYAHGHGFNPVQWTTTTTDIVVLSTTTMSGYKPCPICNAYWIKVTIIKEKIRKTTLTAHYHMNSQMQEVLQSTGTSVSTSNRYRTSESACQNTNCGG